LLHAQCNGLHGKYITFTVHLYTKCAMRFLDTFSCLSYTLLLTPDLSSI